MIALKIAHKRTYWHIHRTTCGRRPTAPDENIDLCPVFLKAIISALKNTKHAVAETHCVQLDFNEIIDSCILFY